MIWYQRSTSNFVWVEQLSTKQFVAVFFIDIYSYELLSYYINDYYFFAVPNETNCEDFDDSFWGICPLDRVAADISGSRELYLAGELLLTMISSSAFA